MNRTYAAKRLLEHGPLTAQEFLEITGWEPRAATRTLQHLMNTGVVTCTHPWKTNCPRNYRHKMRIYALASSSTAGKCGSLNLTTPEEPMTTTVICVRGSEYLSASGEVVL